MLASAIMLSCATPAARGTSEPGAVAPLALPPVAPPAPESTPQTKPPPTPVPSATSQAKERPKFDAEAAEAAIRALDFDSCITEPGRQFQGYVQRTFGPDGRSPGGRLHLDFSAGGPPDRSMSKCMGDLLRTLRIPEFGGSAMQVRGDFTIKNRTLKWRGPFTVQTEPEPPPQSD